MSSPTRTTRSTSSTSSRPAGPSTRNLQEEALQALKRQTRRERRRNPETDLTRACLEVLRLRRIEAWRQQSGGIAIPSPTGRRFVRLGRTGAADITGILGDGRRLEVECKMLGQPLRPEQALFLEMIRQRRGVAIVAHSAAELDFELRRMGL